MLQVREMFLASRDAIARSVTHVGMSGAILSQHVTSCNHEAKLKCFVALYPRMLAVLREHEANLVEGGASYTYDMSNMALMKAWAALAEEQVPHADKKDRKWLLDMFVKWGIAHDTLVDLQLALLNVDSIARSELLEVGANLFTLAHPPASYSKLRHNMLEVYMVARHPPVNRLPKWIVLLPKEDGYLCEMEEQLSELLDEARDYFSDFFPEYDETEQWTLLDKDIQLRHMWDDMLDTYINIHCNLQEAACAAAHLNHGLTARFIAFIKHELQMFEAHA
jgi:hypothetical protein